MKRIFKIFLILIGTVFALLAITPTVISLASGKIIAKINDNILGSLEVGQVNVGWFQGVALKRVKLQDPLGNEVFSAKSIRFDDTLISMLSAPRNIGHLVIEEPRTNIIETKDGITLEQALEAKIREPAKQESKEKTTSHPPLFFTHCSIQNGTFCFLRADCETICVSNFSANLAVTNFQRIDADIKASIQKGTDLGSLEITASGDNVWEIANTYKALIRGKISEETQESCEFHLHCALNRLPMTVLDTFSGLFLTGERKFFSSCLGESLNLTLDHSLDDNKMSLEASIESQNLHAKVDCGLHDNILEIKEGKISGTLTPKLFRALTINKREIHGYELLGDAPFYLACTTTSMHLNGKAEDKEPLSINFAFETPMMLQNVAFKREFTVLPEGKIWAKSFRDSIHMDASVKIQYGNDVATVHAIGEVKEIFEESMKASATLETDGATAALSPFIETKPEYIRSALGREFHSRQNIEFPTLAKSLAFHLESLFSSDTMKLQSSAGFDGKVIKVAPCIVLGEFSPDQMKAIDSRCELLTPLRFKLEAQEIEIDPSNPSDPISAMSLVIDPFEVAGRPQEGTLIVKKVALTEKRGRNDEQRALGATIELGLEKASPALQALIGNELDLQLNVSGKTRDLLAKNPTFYAAKLTSATLKGEASSSHQPEVDFLLKKEAASIFKDLVPITLTQDLHCHAVMTSPLPCQNEIALSLKFASIGLTYQGTAFNGYSLSAPLTYNFKTSSLNGRLETAPSVTESSGAAVAASFAVSPARKGSEFPYAITTEGRASNIPSALVAACAKKPPLATVLGPNITLDWNVCLFDLKNPDRVNFGLIGKDLSLHAAFRVQNGKLQAVPPCEVSLLATQEKLEALAAATGAREFSNQYVLEKECPIQISLSKFEMPYKALFEPNQFSLGCMSGTATLESGAAIFTPKKGEGRYGFFPLSATCELLPSKGLSLAIQSKKMGEEKLAGLAVNIRAKNLFNETGLTCDRAEIALDGTLENVPLALLEQIQGKENKLAALLGDTCNLRLTGTMKTFNEGSYSVKIESERAAVEIATSIKNGSLFLTKPIRGTLDITKKSGKALLKGAAPKLATAFYADHPIEFYVDNTGFVIPLENFALSKILIPSARVDLGQIWVKKGGSLEVVSDLLGLDSSKEMNLWFTPLYLQVQYGTLVCQRVDVLIDDRAHLCAWGSVDLPHDHMDLRVGIFGESLRKAFPMRNIDDNYVLQLPLRGPIGSAKIDKKYATAKIASLSLSGSRDKTGAVIGGLLGAAAQAGEPDVPVPERTASPFPWEKRGR
jgi:hypothetical protein